MKKRALKRIIAVLLAMFILANLTSVGAVDEPISASGKIEAELLEKLETISKDERIPVWIWRESIAPTKISEMLMAEKGYNTEAYEDPNRFTNEIYPIIAEEVESKLGYSKAHSVVSIMEDSEILEEITPIESAVRERINDFIIAKRAIYKREYISSNNDFLDRVLPNFPKEELVYCGKYSSTIIANLTKDEINSVIKDNSVEEVSLFQNAIAEPALADALSQVGVYCEGGTGFDQLDGWLGFSGYGVTVGIIEANYGRYDSTAPQLANHQRLHYVNNIRENGTVVNSSVTSHATHVTIALAGKRVVQDGIVYPAGVVPDATVYQTSLGNMDELFSGINVLVDNGAVVINCSLGSQNDSPLYTSYDKEVDRLIIDKSIVFVVAAGNVNVSGNPGYVKSPGKALNSITVGNVDTTGGSLPYPIFDGIYNPDPLSRLGKSCYIEESYLPNKPDISAPGTELVFGLASDSGTGTSYSAPIVAGIAAQMIQARSSLATNPLLIKAKLLLSANKDLISIVNNSAEGNYFYDRSGAGFVDAIASVNCAFSNTSFFNNYSQNYTTQSFYCTAGQKLRAVLVFDRRHVADISSSYDLDDIDYYLRKNGEGTICAHSNSSKNNVEIIEYTISSNGYYSFIVNGYRIVDTLDAPGIAISYKLS